MMAPMPSANVLAAAQRAHELAATPSSRPREGHRRRRWLAVGDPQTTPERYFDVIDAAGALGDDGMLLPDFGLVSMGDHFDFGTDVAVSRAAGPALLAWLAAHAPDQVVILAGNHDIVRVCELAFETDGSWAEARAMAAELGEDRGSLATFHERFPNIPLPALVRRDFAGFEERQRALVQRLLLDGRMQLAVTARCDALASSDLLLVHTAITPRELAGLGLDVDAPAKTIAAALSTLLREAVARVAARWCAGLPAALDLAPVYVAGVSGFEGGGFLYHRPGDPDADGGGRRDDYAGARPRRFDPRALPRDLAQVVGHDPHPKRAKEMSAWTTDAARAAGDGHLRTLRVHGDAPVYDLGLAPHVGGGATLYLTDAGLGRGAERVPVMWLDEVHMGA